MGDKYHIVHDLIEAIKTTFIVRDYELENAGGLKEVCQSGKPYAVYMSSFNDSLADFNDEVSEKLKVLLFAWGLDDDSVRAYIITRFRRNEWTTLVERGTGLRGQAGGLSPSKDERPCQRPQEQESWLII